MSQYVETDYLWEAVGNLRNAANQPDYEPLSRLLLGIAEQVQSIHDVYFQRDAAQAEPKGENEVSELPENAGLNAAIEYMTRKRGIRLVDEIEKGILCVATVEDPLFTVENGDVIFTEKGREQMIDLLATPVELRTKGETR